MATILQVEKNSEGVSDLYLPIGAQKLTALSEPASTMQLLRDIFAVHIGDWFLNQLAGVDREILTGKLTSLVPPEVEVRRVLLQVPGITSVIRVRAKRLTTLAEAKAVGAESQWAAAPGRLLYVEGMVSSSTQGVLDFGFAFPVTPTT